MMLSFSRALLCFASVVFCLPLSFAGESDGSQTREGAVRDQGEGKFRDGERLKRMREMKQRWNKDGNRTDRNGAKDGMMRSDRPDGENGERRGKHSDKSKRDRLKNHFMEKLKQDNPERYEKIKARMEQFRKLEGQTRELAQAYKTADEAKKAEIKAKLMTILGQTFDMRQEERRLKMKMVEQRLDALKKEIDLRQNHKDDVIKKYFEEITGASKHLEW